MRRSLVSALVALACAAGASGLRAETGQVRIAVQPGMSMMPVVLMREMKLVEKELEARGLGTVRVAYEKISGGPSQNDALLSNSVDYATGGTPAMLLLFDKTRGSRNAIVGIGSMASIPQQLFTRNPNVRSIADFTDQDRIAMPAVRIGLMPILLQMAAVKQWGPDQWNRLDRLTVQMAHADATAVLSAKVPTEITAHFSGPPQMYQQRRDPMLRMILDSTSITGGPITQNAMWAKREFVEANPKVNGAVFAALEDAMRLVKEKPLEAARAYLAAESWRFEPEEIAAAMKEPGVTFEVTPVKSKFFADFMKQVGLIKEVPDRWQDFWIKALHDRPGS